MRKLSQLATPWPPQTQTIETEDGDHGLETAIGRGTTGIATKMTAGSAIDEEDPTTATTTSTTPAAGETVPPVHPQKSIEEDGGAQTIVDGTTETGTGNDEGATLAAAVPVARQIVGADVNARRSRHNRMHSILNQIPRQCRRNPHRARKKNPTSPTPALSPRRPTR